MDKNFVLDTNVLLHDPQAINAFDEHTVNIPITVIEEIDRFKKGLDETGRNARQISRFLDSLRESGDLKKGIPIGEKGGKIRVVFGSEFVDMLPKELVGEKADNRILAVCLALQEREKPPVIFVTKDTNLRIKANVLGINAEDYERGHVVSIDELYSGNTKRFVSAEAIESFFKVGSARVEQEPPDAGDVEGGDFTSGGTLYSNEYVHLVSEVDPQQNALGRHTKDGEVVALQIPKDIWGIHPRNREQRFAMDALLNPDISLVTLVGQAGTGKTLLAIAAGLQMSVEEQVYKRLLVSRPIFPMGRDIGFLPGDVQEKLRPWMQPVFDNVEFLFSGVEGRDGKKHRGYEELIEMDMLALEPLTYIRGRSIPYQYIIVDEAQNLTPHEVKTIITRAGEGAKIVLTGDPYQIDNPYIDSTSNGLSYCVERFKGQEVAAHVTLIRGERSSLAELAAELL